MNRLYFIVLIFILGCAQRETEERVEYTPLSNSVIMITYQSNRSDTLYVETRTNTNIPRDGSRSNSLVLVEDGTYFLNIIIDRPVSSQLEIDDEHFNIIIEPNDTAQVRVDKNEGELNLDFAGKNTEPNLYYLRKKESLGYVDIRYPLNTKLTSHSTYSSVKQSTDSIISLELKFLSNYKKSNNLPSWFINYEFAEITYSGAGFKTHVPVYNKRFQVFSDRLPDDYFNYLGKIEINNHSAVFSSQYLWFLDDYFLRTISDGYNELSGLARSQSIHSHILTQSKSGLSGRAKDIYHKYQFSSILRYYSDSIKIDSLAKEYAISDHTPLLTILGAKSKGSVELFNLQVGDTIPEFYLINELDTIVSLRDFNDKALYLNFWATWCRPCIKNIPKLNQMIAEFSKDHKMAFLNICIDSEKSEWPTTVSRYNLNGINLLAEGNWNSKLRTYFNIQGIPHYAIIGEDNVLYENFANKAPLVKERISEMLETTVIETP